MIFVYIYIYIYIVLLYMLCCMRKIINAMWLRLRGRIDGEHPGFPLAVVVSVPALPWQPKSIKTQGSLQHEFSLSSLLLDIRHQCFKRYPDFLFHLPAIDLKHSLVTLKSGWFELLWQNFSGVNHLSTLCSSIDIFVRILLLQHPVISVLEYGQTIAPPPTRCQWNNRYISTVRSLWHLRYASFEGESMCTWQVPSRSV